MYRGAGPDETPPPLPPTHQVSDFFTLAETVASLTLQDLLFINGCGSVVLPNPVRMPTAAFCQTGPLFSIIYNR